MTNFIQLLFGGLALGCDYALIALGFTIIFKASQVINFAQGEFLPLGAYVVSVAMFIWKLPFIIALLVGMVVTVAVGVLFQRIALRRMIGQPPYSILVRGIEASVLPACQRYGMGVIAWSPLAGGWLTGRYRKDADIDMSTGRARRLPHRFDPSLPGNQAKLAAVEELIKVAADAGCSLIHLALAFVTAHQAVTSAIIGPRTMDQLTDLLAGASVTLDDAVLDRIDQIVPPGVNLNPADAGWQPPVLTDPAARRRPRPARGVA